MCSPKQYDILLSPLPLKSGLYQATRASWSHHRINYWRAYTQIKHSKSFLQCHSLSQQSYLPDTSPNTILWVSIVVFWQISQAISQFNLTYFYYIFQCLCRSGTHVVLDVYASLTSKKEPLVPIHSLHSVAVIQHVKYLPGEKSLQPKSWPHSSASSFAPCTWLRAPFSFLSSIRPHHPQTGTCTSLCSEKMSWIMTCKEDSFDQTVPGFLFHTKSPVIPLKNYPTEAHPVLNVSLSVFAFQLFVSLTNSR